MKLVHSTLKQYCNDVFIFVHPQTKDISIDDFTIMYVSTSAPAGCTCAEGSANGRPKLNI